MFQESKRNNYFIFVSILIILFLGGGKLFEIIVTFSKFNIIIARIFVYISSKKLHEVNLAGK